MPEIGSEGPKDPKGPGEWLRDLFRIFGKRGQGGTDGEALGPHASNIGSHGRGVNENSPLETGESGGTREEGNPLDPDNSA